MATRATSLGITVIRRVIALACVGAGVMAAFGSVAHAGGETAREVLSRAQEYVSEAESVEYTADAEAIVADPTSAGGSYEFRGAAEDSALFPDRGHSRIQFEGHFTEMLYIGKDVYFRDGSTREELAGLRFGKVDLDEDDILTEADLFLFQRPQDLDDALERARDPRIVGRDGGNILLEVSFPAGMLEPLALETLTDVDGQLWVAPHGRLERLVVNASGSSTQMEIDYRFSGWNGPLTIAAPPKSERDPTPVIDEEQVAAYTDTPLFQPAAVPKGWTIDYAEVLPASETGHGCREVNVDLSAPNYDLAFILLFQLPLACADDATTLSESGDTPLPREEFTAGPYRGYIEEDPECPGDYSVAIDVNSTRIEAETTGLSKRQIAQIFANLVPLDLMNPPPGTLRYEPPRTEC